MAITCGPSLRALHSHAILGRTDLVSDSMVRVGYSLEIVDLVDEVQKLADESRSEIVSVSGCS